VTFLRMDAPEWYGDDVSGFRPMLIDAVETQEAIGGMELSRDGMGIIGVAPVWNDSELVGTLEVGFDFALPFLEAYVSNWNIDGSILLFADHGLDPAATGATSVGDDYWVYATTIDEHLPVASSIYDQARISDVPLLTTLNYNGARYQVLVGPLIDYSGNVVGLVEFVADYSQALRQIVATDLRILGVTIAIMLATSIVAYLIARRISAPLVAISDAANSVAEGSFSQVIDVTSEDEIGQLAKAFNEMTESLNRLLVRTGDTSQYLSASGEQLADMIEQMSSGVEEISVTLNEMAQGAGVQADRAEDISRAITQLAKTTDQISANMQQTYQSSTSAAQLMDEQVEIVDLLASKLSRIEHIVTMVEKISDQTNLLSLNASIEAARAGEYGAGFAVVAAEVRRLAERVALSVGEIASLSQEISEQLVPTLEKLHQTQAAVAQMTVLSQATAADTEEQTHLSGDMVDAINSMAAVAEQNAVASEQVATTVEQQAAAISEIAASAQSLVQVAIDLRQILTEFGISES
jgi:methyl-accepting chemotaxis protein